ncbi:transporter substrate-binding domain-containing protein [Rhizobium sp. BK068]|uniref:transporter substrate-binding domain-containing protein n=1 Tax=Rhizobium sp. BK068 TaxID=2512130 RepID=UPI00104381C7|nr:transporter substrate-binding domain-containing protein [Rhizobium sp. BK068]TCM74941.1 amino acid ABC transporter substrate-binding protein (PAAT family) [Rhizobium sp. BK068]
MNDTKGSETSRRMFGKLVATSALGAAMVVATRGGAVAQEVAQGARIAQIKERGVLRVAAPVGEPPYFVKDIKSGTLIGACVDMANDIAQILGVKTQFVDSTWGDQIIQLQTDKVDIGMASSLTPARALSVSFSKPYFQQGFGIIVKPSFEAASWSDINKPEVRVAVDMGSTQETAIRQNAPNATVTAFPKRDDVILALQSGRADCGSFAVVPGLTAVRKVPNLGRFIMLESPRVTMPTGLVIAKGADREWRDFLDIWVEYNRSSGQISRWMRGGLALSGITDADIPQSVDF